MKENAWKFNQILLTFLPFILVLFNTCQKESPRQLPAILTGTVTNVMAYSVEITGEIINLGDGIEQYGHCWALTAGPNISGTKSSMGAAKSTGTFTSKISGLQPVTLYWVRAYAICNGEIVYGEELQFITTSSKVLISTNEISNITAYSAISGGNIVNEGMEKINSRGVCWNLLGSPTINDEKTLDGAGAGSFTSQITGLIADTIYYVRSYAITEYETIYGEEKNFHTDKQFKCGIDKVMDYDSNEYITVQIGNQCWMAENLKTTHFVDGTAIPLIEEADLWEAKGIPVPVFAYCYYNNDILNKDPFGALYTWYAATRGEANGSEETIGVQGVCPTGWHLPSHDEWSIMEISLGMSWSSAYIDQGLRGTNEGGKLKEQGTVHWKSPNTGADNQTGFTALPGGWRQPNGLYRYQGEKAFYWTSTERTPNYPRCRVLGYNYAGVYYWSYSIGHGLSVRCIKDQ